MKKLILNSAFVALTLTGCSDQAALTKAKADPDAAKAAKAAKEDPRRDVFETLPRQRLLPSVVVTAAHFNSIQQGMSYDEVVQVIGRNGIETASTSYMDSVPGEILRVTVFLKTYSWSNPDGSGMVATFQSTSVVSRLSLGNGLVTKVQVGLAVGTPDGRAP